MPSTLVTTYRHDYVDPKEMALSVTLANSMGTGSKKTDSAKPCNCVPADEAATALSTIAPPTINSPPTQAADDDTENDDPTCEHRNPHKYLDTISNVYPLLFDDLKRMNKDDLQSMLNTDRMRSTYQNDFGRLTEFPVYDDTGDASVDPAKDAMIEQFRLQLRDPCGEGAVFKDRSTRIKACGYRPPFRVNVCAKHCPVNQREQDQEKRYVVQSEYAANTSKLGGTIMQVNLHSHSKCKPSRCIHEIRYSLLDK